MAMTEFTIMSFVCFIQAAKYGAADLLLPAHLPVLAEDARTCTGGGVLAQLSCEMRASTLKRGLSQTISDCVVHPVATFIAFARAGEIDRTATNCLGCFLYDFVDATIIFVSEWETIGLKRGLREDALPGVVHAKVVPCQVDEFCDACMFRE